MDNWIKDKLEKIDSKLDRLDSRLDRVDVTLAKQEITLDVHVKRTNINEENINLLRQKQENEFKNIQNQFLPINKERAMVKGIGRFLGALTALAGLISGFLAAIKTYLH